ncbi:hypothetical protein CC80DRAFT_519077 [Byssothecium circinans]|uniref:Uncharacterized protein n=1 Tax=Byssothecium circinans TaxID=147558 RepID=A0A6A5TG77_9PLEO|nr:hypothetical protein CC80DRAFT_519077 [Byssothecium circinans]
MAFFFNNPQRRVLPQSGETKQPPTPGPPIVDEYHERYERETARAKSKPLVQFKSQAKRERARLEHQLSEERFGRRQTLPWDNGSDLRANSENNVRSRWVEQGIWGDEWGPAWPKDSHPMTTKWTHRGDGPFFGPYNPTTTKTFPGARWGHEESDPEPEPEPEQPRAPGSWIWGANTSQPKRPTSPQPIGYIQTTLGPLPQYPIPKPTVRKPEASRPYHQFLYQISKERDWIKDEIDYKTPGSVVDLDAIAHQSVKNNWIEDGIWDPKWDELPGMTWIHEEPEEEEVVEAPTAFDHAGGRRPDAAADDRHQSHGPRYPNLFAPAPIPEATNGHADDSPAPAAGGTETSNAKRQTGGRKRGVLGRQPAITDIAQPKEAPRRSLRIASVAAASRKPKRSRNYNAIEDKQPLKRLRYNSHDSGLFSHKASDTANTTPNIGLHDSRTVATRNVGEVRTLAGNKKAVMTSGGTGWMRITAVSNPCRRSARIAEREKQLRVAAELQKPRSPPTKTAKRGRPTRGGQLGRSRPK